MASSAALPESSKDFAISYSASSRSGLPGSRSTTTEKASEALRTAESLSLGSAP